MIVHGLYLIFTSTLMLCVLLVLLLMVFVIGTKLWFEPFAGICVCKTKLHGRVAIVTGGNSGIGLETAKDLARRGAKVIIACRDGKKSQEVITEIINSTRNPDVSFKHLDLSKFDSIRSFAKEINETEPSLHILVNNAGAAGLKMTPTQDGIDKVVQVNYLGPFLLTNLLLDKLKASKPSRIVIVSSLFHYYATLDVEDLAGLKTEGYIKRYANSKLCNILWAKALSRRLPSDVTVNALHPGVVKTNIFNRMASIQKKIIFFLIGLLFKNAEEGAQTTIHLCVAPELVNATAGYYADCKPTKTSKSARDFDLAEKVWYESLRLTQ